LKHLLVPVDGSECSKLAIGQAIELAKAFSSKITLLNVYEMQNFRYYGANNVVIWQESFREMMVKNSAEILDEAKKSCAAIDSRIEVDTVSLEGNPADTIVEFAEKHDEIDLLVMGSHGMGGVRRFFLGSTTHKVAVAIEKPILII
jgi:nucleotide-binding universal stress UspA family protein